MASPLVRNDVRLYFVRRRFRVIQNDEVGSEFLQLTPEEANDTSD
jgi:hypothetical protein